jgi:hypothetical protein
MTVSDTCKLKELESENARLKKIAAGQMLAIESLKCRDYRLYTTYISLRFLIEDGKTQKIASWVLDFMARLAGIELTTLGFGVIRSYL